MKKAGLYDQYRYPNRLYLSTETFDSRGKEPSLGSGTRAPPSGRGTPPRILHNQSTPSTFDTFDDSELLPRRRTVTSKGWSAFGFQLFSLILIIVIFLGPGWGRSKKDARTEEARRSYVHSYHGVWLLCETQVVGQEPKCIYNIIVPFTSGWWMSVQALSCVFLLLSIINTILISIYVFRIKSNRKWKLSLTHGLLSILNCCVIASSLIVFAIFFLDDSWWCCPNDQQVTETILYWAWYFGVLALITQFISACMTIAETVHLRR